MAPAKSKGSASGESVISRSSSHSSLSARASAAVGKVKTAARKVTQAVKAAVDNVRPKRKKARTERAQDAIENGDDEVQFLATSPVASQADNNSQKDRESDSQVGSGSQVDAASRESSPEVRELTEEELLAEMKKKWNSPIYSFFSEDVTICEGEDGRRYHFFKCTSSRCKGRGIKGVKRAFENTDGSRASDSGSNSNLRKHAILCFGQHAVDSAIAGQGPKNPDGSIFAVFARAGQKPLTVTHRAHTDAEARAHIVEWVTESTRPPNIVNDRGFRTLMTAGRPNLHLPSARTISRDIQASFMKCKATIDKLLQVCSCYLRKWYFCALMAVQNHPGQLSFATDAWTSPNHRAFVAWTVHLHHEGTPLCFLLDIIEVPESHSGTTLARAFDTMLAAHGLSDKILAMTGDNATSNDTQTTAMSELDTNTFTEENRVRCFTHTLNLACKSILKPFSAPEKKKDPDTDEGDAEGDTDSIPDLESDTGSFDGAFADGEGEEEEEEAEDEGNVDADADEDEDMQRRGRHFDEETKEVKKSLDKIRKLSFAIIHSTTILLPAWRKICRKCKLKERMIPRDVRTRWNSTYDMLYFSQNYRPAIDAITSEKSYKLRKYELDETEWEIIGDLVYVLEVFKKATLYFSSDSISTIANVVSTMDLIDEVLESRGERQLQPAVLSAVSLGRATLKRYYVKTGLSDIYYLAVALHPSSKLEYFRINKFSKTAISTIETKLRTQFNLYRERAEENQPESNVSSQDVSPSVSPSAALNFSMFQNLGAIDEESRDELADYLAAPRVKTDDPMKWWWAHRREYPVLHQLALDYLSVPSTSVAVERVFSLGRRLLHFTRNRMSATSFRRLLCLGSWGRRDLLRINDLIAACSPKKRKRVPVQDDANSLGNESNESVE